MTIAALEIVEAVSALGLSLKESFNFESVQWEVQVGDWPCVVIELRESGELLSATSSYAIDLRRLALQDRNRLLTATLRHNARLKIGHYELARDQLQYRAVLLVEGTSVSRDLLDRWLQSVVAQSYLFRQEGIPG